MHFGKLQAIFLFLSIMITFASGCRDRYSPGDAQLTTAEENGEGADSLRFSVSRKAPPDSQKKSRIGPVAFDSPGGKPSSEMFAAGLTTNDAHKDSTGTSEAVTTPARDSLIARPLREIRESERSKSDIPSTPALQLQLLFTIGEATGDTPYVFGEVEDAIMLPTGGIALLDSKMYRVQVFDENGNYIASEPVRQTPFRGMAPGMGDG